MHVQPLVAAPYWRPPKSSLLRLRRPSWLGEPAHEHIVRPLSRQTWLEVHGIATNCVGDEYTRCGELYVGSWKTA